MRSPWKPSATAPSSATYFAQCATTSPMHAARRNWTTCPRIGWHMSSQCYSPSKRSCTQTHCIRRWTSTHSRSCISKSCISITQRGAANAETPTSPQRRSNMSTHQPKPRRLPHPRRGTSEGETPNLQQDTKEQTREKNSTPFINGGT